MAYLFHFYHEDRWKRKLKIKHLKKSRRFSKNFCFTDDLTCINDEEEFKGAIQDIYLPKLELKKESTATSEGSFVNHYTRIVGFLQSVNGGKDENPTRKTCSEYFKAYGWWKWKT